jgi:hypothetical protein
MPDDGEHDQRDEIGDALATTTGAVRIAEISWSSPGGGSSRAHSNLAGVI